MGRRRVYVRPGGVVEWVAEPALEPLTACGPTVGSRVSDVVPARRAWRWLFVRLRRRFGDRGWVAAFTRRWPVRWAADLGRVGGPLLGPFPTRDRAIRAEVEWLHANSLGRRAGG